jgi:hypothetical protein
MSIKRENNRIVLEALAGIPECLEALAIANKTIDTIKSKLDVRGSEDADWFRRATDAHKSWSKTRRRITEKLAVLRRDERETNKLRMQYENEELLKLLRQQVPSADLKSSIAVARALAEERLQNELSKSEANQCQR